MHKIAVSEEKTCCHQIIEILHNAGNMQKNIKTAVREV